MYSFNMNTIYVDHIVRSQISTLPTSSTKHLIQMSKMNVQLNVRFKMNVQLNVRFKMNVQLDDFKMNVQLNVRFKMNVQLDDFKMNVPPMISINDLSS